MNSDGSNHRQLTTQGRNFYPAWHPDGMRITFDSDDLGTAPFYFTWIIGADGSNPHRLCLQQPAGRQASWHPGGEKYVYMRGADLSEEIFVGDTTSCADLQLTADALNDRDPVFSPPGDQIAFTRIADPPPAQIWVMNPDGTGQRQLTREGGGWPTWSPDGRRIAYVRDNSSQRCASQGVLWVLDVHQGPFANERQLTYQWPSQCESLASVSEQVRGPH